MESNHSVTSFDLQKIKQKLLSFKYPALVLALGVLLLLWPQEREQLTQTEALSENVHTDIQGLSEHAQLQQQLAQILSDVEGAGKVSVMLTVKAGEKTIYQTDDSQSGEDGEDGGSHSSATVIVSADGGGQNGLAVQIIGAEYQGALVVSEGADSARVRLNLVNAVAALTGLSTDQITVVKMKS